jgi:hypothetical protein
MAAVKAAVGRSTTMREIGRQVGASHNDIAQSNVNSEHAPELVDSVIAGGCHEAYRYALDRKCEAHNAKRTEEERQAREEQLALRGGECEDPKSEASHNDHEGDSFVVKPRVRCQLNRLQLDHSNRHRAPQCCQPGQSITHEHPKY